MNHKRKIGAVLLAIVALALMPAAALASTTGVHAHSHSILDTLIGVGLAIGGTVTVTYSSFAADNPTPQFGTPFTGGSNVAPTAQQSGSVNRINALVGFTDTDTSITITHNWGLSAAAQAANEPDILVRQFALGSSNTFVGGAITWVVTTNTVVGTKANIAGSGGTICVTLRLPATPGN
jgi:hypothetical protein